MSALPACLAARHGSFQTKLRHHQYFPAAFSHTYLFKVTVTARLVGMYVRKQIRLKRRAIPRRKHITQINKRSSERKNVPPSVPFASQRIAGTVCKLHAAPVMQCKKKPFRTRPERKEKTVPGGYPTYQTYRLSCTVRFRQNLQTEDRERPLSSRETLSSVRGYSSQARTSLPASRLPTSTHWRVPPYSKASANASIFLPAKRPAPFRKETFRLPASDRMPDCLPRTGEPYLPALSELCQQLPADACLPPACTSCQGKQASGK